MPKDKQSEDEVLIARAVEMTIWIIYDKGLSNHYYNDADEVLGKHLVSERRRPDLEELNDVTERFYS